jgi:hypothetical protein
VIAVTQNLRVFPATVAIEPEVEVAIPLLVVLCVFVERSTSPLYQLPTTDALPIATPVALFTVIVAVAVLVVVLLTPVTVKADISIGVVTTILIVAAADLSPRESVT